MGTTTRRDATRCCKFTMGRVKPGVLDALGVQVSANGIVAGLAGPVWEARLCLETHKDSDRLLHGSHGREAPRPQKRENIASCLTWYLVEHLGGGKTDGRERHGPRSTSPVSPRPAPDLRYTSPASDRQKPTALSESQMSRCRDGGEPWMETGEPRHRPFWEAATRPSVSRDQ